MLFSTGLMASAGIVIVTAIVDKRLEDSGYFWLSTTLKLALPLTGFILGVYFLEHNEVLRWLK